MEDRQIMRIGLVDVDGHARKKKWGATIYPNIALGKISRYRFRCEKYFEG